MSTRNDRLLRLHHTRGAAMVETVSVLGFILALLFGAAEIALAGFYQLQLDAATFLYSHSFAINNSVSPAVQQKLQPVVPVVQPTQLNTVATSPPDTSSSDNNGLKVLGYYTTGGTPAGPTDPVNNRYGGASIIRPQQIVTKGALTLPTFDFSVFSNSLPMSGGNIEGRSMVANHDDDSTGYGYNSGSANGNLVLPSTTGGDDQNVPPYYFTRAYMEQFSALYALGLAEYLQDNSYPSAGNGNYSSMSQGIGIGSMFGAMTLHQQYFAKLAQLLKTAPFATYSMSLNGPLNAYATCFAQWDVNTGAVSPSNDFGTQFPMHPVVTPTGC